MFIQGCTPDVKRKVHHWFPINFQSPPSQTLTFSRHPLEKLMRSHSLSLSLYIYIYIYILPENGWLVSLLLGWPIFRCYVSFWEGIWYVHVNAKGGVLNRFWKRQPGNLYRGMNIIVKMMKEWSPGIVDSKSLRWWSFPKDHFVNTFWNTSAIMYIHMYI